MPLPDEKELMKQIGLGDQQAFAVLYGLHKNKVYDLALSYCQNVHDAEEVTQQAFIKIFKNAGGFKGNSAVSTWIYRVTMNTALTYIQRRKKNTFEEYGTQTRANVDFVHPGVLLEKKEDSVLLYKVIKTLPANQKSAFILSYIQGLPRNEVAEVMDLSLKAVESLLQRGKVKLRSLLEKDYPNRRK